MDENDDGRVKDVRLTSPKSLPIVLIGVLLALLPLGAAAYFVWFVLTTLR